MNSWSVPVWPLTTTGSPGCGVVSDAGDVTMVTRMPGASVEPGSTSDITGTGQSKQWRRVWKAPTTSCWRLAAPSLSAARWSLSFHVVCRRRLVSRRGDRSTAAHHEHNGTECNTSTRDIVTIVRRFRGHSSSRAQWEPYVGSGCDSLLARNRAAPFHYVVFWGCPIRSELFADGCGPARSCAPRSATRRYRADLGATLRHRRPDPAQCLAPRSRSGALSTW